MIVWHSYINLSYSGHFTCYFKKCKIIDYALLHFKVWPLMWYLCFQETIKNTCLYTLFSNHLLQLFLVLWYASINKLLLFEGQCPILPVIYFFLVKTLIKTTSFHLCRVFWLCFPLFIFNGSCFICTLCQNMLQMYFLTHFLKRRKTKKAEAGRKAMKRGHISKTTIIGTKRLKSWGRKHSPLCLSRIRKHTLFRHRLGLTDV